MTSCFSLEDLQSAQRDTITSFNLQKKDVNISTEKISELLELLKECTSLSQLHLNGMSLFTLSTMRRLCDVFHFTKNLKELDLGSNGLSDDSISMLMNVMILNGISLTSLRLSGNFLESFPVQIELFQGLEVLDLRENYISRIPKELPSSLKDLNLSTNQISNDSWLDHLNTAHNLERLNLSCNCISRLPHSWSFRLISLRKIDLSYNPSISRIPSSLKSLKNLQSVNFEFTGLTENDKTEFKRASGVSLVRNNMSNPLKRLRHSKVSLLKGHRSQAANEFASQINHKKKKPKYKHLLEDDSILDT